MVVAPTTGTLVVVEAEEAMDGVADVEGRMTCSSWCGHLRPGAVHWSNWFSRPERDAGCIQARLYLISRSGAAMAVASSSPVARPVVGRSPRSTLTRTASTKMSSLRTHGGGGR